MAAENFFGWRTVDRVLGHRAFPFVFWGLTLALLILTWRGLNLGSLFEDLEKLTLDARLRFRAESLTPSKDIVIVSLDRNTENYLRNHPDMGIDSLTLPRNRVAQMVDYFTAQGARAVILDVVFKEDKSGDAALARSIEKAGNVFVATRFESDLNDFIELQREQTPELMPSRVLYQVFIRPYMQMRPAVYNLPGMHGYAGLLNLGLGPFFPVSQTMRIPEPLLEKYLNGINLELAKNRSYSATPYVRNLLQTQIPPVTDLEKALYQSSCLTSVYNNYYGAKSPFLQHLLEKRLDVWEHAPVPDAADRLMSYCYAVPLSGNVLAAAQGIGVTSVDYDKDAFIRTVPMLFRGYQGKFYTYLGISPALWMMGVEQVNYTPGFLDLPIEQGVYRRRVPLSEGRDLIINWRSPVKLVENLYAEAGYTLSPEEKQGIHADRNNPALGRGHLYRMVSAVDVLRTASQYRLKQEPARTLYRIPDVPESGPFSFKDKIVVYGNTVTDIHRTPIGSTTYGPEILATVLDMMMNDTKFVQKAPEGLVYGIVLALGVLILLGTVGFASLGFGFTLGFILLALYWIICVTVFYVEALWFPMVWPTCFLLFCQMGGTLYRYYIHDREKNQIASVFSKYVSPQIMEQILLSPDQAMDKLKGQKKELTVMFADLRGFTSQFENADPEVMVAQLNEFFDVMTEVILQHGGTYDKYMGDCIMSFFGAPLEVPNHAEQACRAALEMQKQMRHLNDSWTRGGLPALRLSVGIASGEMYVGNFGSRNIKNFTVMGTNVNLGSRLETYTRKEANVSVIISERTRELAISKVKTRDLGRIPVKGFSAPVQIYALEGVARLKGAVWNLDAKHASGPDPDADEKKTS